MKARARVRRTKPLFWRKTLTLVALVAISFARPAAAQYAQPGQDEIGVVYLGNGQVLAATHPRLLTKNAHVVQFLCSPAGTRVAYLGEIAGPAGVDASLAIVSTESGEVTNYYHSIVTVPNQPDSTLLNGLEGWSEDSAYCAFDLCEFGPLPVGSASIDHLEAVDLVHDTVFDIPLPLDQLFGAQTSSDSTPTLAYVNLVGAAWAPGLPEIAFVARVQTTDGSPVSCLCLCDADRRSTRLLYQSPGFLTFAGWQDSTRLFFMSDKGDYLFDLDAGKAMPVAGAQRKLLVRSAILPGQPIPVISDLPAPNHETLTLAGMASAVSGPDGEPATDTTIWLSRTGGPAKPAHLALDSFPLNLAPFGLGDPQFLPNGGFDREGVYHVVYNDEGDLKIVDLSSRQATPEEKLAGGEKLTCEEEISIAESDARQVGLGILQWAADNNNTFPAGVGFHDEVYPYIRSQSVFTSPNGVGFQYLAPADPKLSDMDAPSDTPLGEFSLPCADVVLYGDGHVKVNQKDTTDR